MLNLNDISFENSTQHFYDVSLKSSMNTATWSFSNFNAATRFARVLIQRAGGDLEPDYATLMKCFNDHILKRGFVDFGEYRVTLHARRTTLLSDFSFAEATAA